jgi:hypothetical protein
VKSGVGGALTMRVMAVMWLVEELVPVTVSG